MLAAAGRSGLEAADEEKQTFCERDGCGGDLCLCGDGIALRVVCAAAVGYLYLGRLSRAYHDVGRVAATGRNRGAGAGDGSEPGAADGSWQAEPGIVELSEDS